MQYDFGGWMPNSPTSLQLPPPTTKETATEKTMLDTFPSVNTTVHAIATLWLLSKESSDRVSALQRLYKRQRSSCMCVFYVMHNKSKEKNAHS